MSSLWQKFCVYVNCCTRTGAMTLVEDTDIEMTSATTITRLNNLNEENLFSQKYYNDNEKEKGIVWVSQLTK